MLKIHVENTEEEELDHYQIDIGIDHEIVTRIMKNRGVGNLNKSQILNREKRIVNTQFETPQLKQASI
jgi:hypothetical protein